MNTSLLIGSPQRQRSASEALGSYLAAQLEQHGLEVHKSYLYNAVLSDEQLNPVIAVTAEAELVVSAAPLYVDSLPAPVTEFLEALAENIDEYERPTQQWFVGISNSGFPEAHQNNVALEIYRCFARQTGYSWAGGLAVGGGPPLKGNSVEDVHLAKAVAAGLDMAAAALAKQQPIPQEAVELLAEPMIPPWLYRTMGDLGWHYQALQNGAWRQLRRRVWIREES